MSRIRALLAGGIVLAVALTGCGIPDETRVVVHGTGPAPRHTTGEVSENTPKPRDDAASREEFVANYLAAAAGDISTAAERVRKFIAPADSADFKPQPELKVVRLVDDPLISPGQAQVLLNVQHVGVLGADGTLRAPAPNESDKYTLDVREAPAPPSGTGGWYVSKPESVLLLSDAALAEYYQTRSVYFWNKDNSALVPDLRYLPKALPPESQPNEILKWLTAGPSDWLNQAVQPLPRDTAAIGNVPDVSDGILRINLTAAALPIDDKEALSRLGRQLMWSMRTNLTTALELRIADDLRETFTGQDFLTSNPAYRVDDRPERFCVYGGQVRRMVTSARADSPVPLLTAQQNHQVRTAALSRADNFDYAALVTVDKAGRTWLLTGGGRTGTTVTLRPTRLAGEPGTPVWLRPTARGGPGAGHGLLTAGGRLYRIFTDGTLPQDIVVPGSAGRISAVAVAPDGLRVALVAGGKVYVTVLLDTGNTVKAAEAREVGTSLERVTGVAWTAENSIVVVGVRPDTKRVAIVDSTVDGGMQSPRLNDLGEARVTHLTAYPANPIASTTTTDSVADALVSYVANGTAYDLSGVPEQIRADDVIGAPLPANAGGPVAPFFLR